MATINKLPFPTSHDRQGGPKGAKPGGASQQPGDGKGTVTESKIEQPQEQKPTEGSEATKQAGGEEGTAGPGELQAKQGLTKQDQGDKQSSGFLPSEDFHALTQLPEQFGHKFQLPPQTGPMVHQEKNLPPGFMREGHLPQRPGNLRQPQRPQPPPEAYQTVVGGRVFKGAMRHSPLHQKLQQHAMANPSQAAASVQASRMAEPLTKGEIMQMFRMRNQTENKERFRDVMRHELAKARAEMAHKIQATKYETDSQQQKEIHQQAEVSAHTLDAKRAQLASKLDSGRELSRFEKVLQNLLGGKKPVPDLPADVHARFATKTSEEWKTFFKNVLAESSALEADQAKTKNLIEALFRGTYTDEVSGEQRLVTDLAFTLEGEVIENKYAQLTIKDEQLLAELAKLNPGDVLGPKILEKMGAELNFLKLVHIVALANVTEEQKQQFLKSLKQTHNTKSQGDLERALIAMRGGEKSKDKDLASFPLPLQNAPQRFTGNQKIYMYLFYGICSFAAVMILWIIFRAVF